MDVKTIQGVCGYSSKRTASNRLKERAARGLPVSQAEKLAARNADQIELENKLRTAQIDKIERSPITMGHLRAQQALNRIEIGGIK